MTKQTVSGRESFRRTTLWFRGPLACTVVALALAGGATSTHGINGESEETRGVFQTGCQGLRAETGTGETPFPGDAIYFCDPAGEQCHLVSATSADAGAALAVCAESIAHVQPNRGGALETGVVVHDTTFGANTGVTGLSGDDDILCETSSGEQKVCVDVFATEGTCAGPSETGGDETVGDVRVRCADSCSAVKALLAASVTSVPNIAWWLFIDYLGDEVPEPLAHDISEVLSVCPGFDWVFADPEAVDAGTVQYQAPKYVISTPAVINTGGTNVSTSCPTGTKLCTNTSLNRAFCEPTPWPVSTDSVCDGK